ncbi:hypothetical protein TWF481_003088 [Arthrobotrys musiformis]|uniref:Uncharacterized protein n=1 Tax=Arthrobotrys musiformis TaxID=47236 RepID=A0AAV9VP84_9PEZI
MCGSNGIPYQCALYTDNTCGNGDIEHTNETEHSTIIPDISNVYKIVFSDADDQWIKASWDDDDQQETIRSYHCIPSVSDYEPSTKTDASGTNESTTDEGSATTEAVDTASETTTNTPSQSSSQIEAQIVGALVGAGFVLMVLYI